MANPFGELPSHSAEYFGDTRDHWWNRDYLELVARRWQLARVRDVLDVGCGVGHWGRTLAEVLPAAARITGVDPDPYWVETARGRAAAREDAARFEYRVGVAEQLPFADGSFDLVTCQTVLIHVADPAAALAEMIRVTRPGGRVAVVEPNNVAGALLDAAVLQEPAEDALALVRLQLLCERGKHALGEGHNSVGELVPALMAAQGLVGVEVSINDKANVVLPPYASAEQQAFVEELRELSRREFWIWSRADTQRYFLAGGGQEPEFEGLWATAIAAAQRAAKAAERGTYAHAGGTVAYLVTGTRPAAP